MLRRIALALSCALVVATPALAAKTVAQMQRYQEEMAKEPKIVSFGKKAFASSYDLDKIPNGRKNRQFNLDLFARVVAPFQNIKLPPLIKTNVVVDWPLFRLPRWKLEIHEMTNQLKKVKRFGFFGPKRWEQIPVEIDDSKKKPWMIDLDVKYNKIMWPFWGLVSDIRPSRIGNFKWWNLNRKPREQAADVEQAKYQQTRIHQKAIEDVQKDQSAETEIDVND